MHAPTITIEQAGLAYAEQNVFQDINLILPANEWVALLGPSGVGKSSLLRMIAGLTSGNEQVRGRIRADNHLPVASQIAYMAQTDLLLPWLTVLDNAMLYCKLRAPTRQERQRSLQQAKHLLEQVGLSHTLTLTPQQLSGGMRQRVALVRTLMQEKPIVLMDEPFSALDAITRYKLQSLAIELLRDKTVLFITHDPAEALRLAHAIYIMHGQPVTLNAVANLPHSPPRDLRHAQLADLQFELLHELSVAAGAAA